MGRRERREKRERRERERMERREGEREERERRERERTERRERERKERERRVRRERRNRARRERREMERKERRERNRRERDVEDWELLPLEETAELLVGMIVPIEETTQGKQETATEPQPQVIQPIQDTAEPMGQHSDFVFPGLRTGCNLMYPHSLVI